MHHCMCSLPPCSMAGRGWVVLPLRALSRDDNHTSARTSEGRLTVCHASLHCIFKHQPCNQPCILHGSFLPSPLSQGWTNKTDLIRTRGRSALPPDLNCFLPEAWALAWQVNRRMLSMLEHAGSELTVPSCTMHGTPTTGCMFACTKTLHHVVGWPTKSHAPRCRR